MVVVDYFSTFPEVVRMPSTHAGNVIEALKGIYAYYGIPEVFRSDNGPQYSSDEFARFLQSLHVKHAPSSPYFPQSN